MFDTTLKIGDYIQAEITLKAPSYSQKTMATEGFISEIKDDHNELILENGQTLYAKSGFVKITKLPNVISLETYQRRQAMKRHPSSRNKNF